MVFVRNAWYVAGWSSEVDSSKPVARTFLGEGVVLFRTEAGKLTALADLCPHRFVPLHIGHLKGEAIQCAYHGLEFGSDGRCVHNPHGHGKVTSSMKVRSFPVAERDGVIWIWMGDPAKADVSDILPFPMLIDPAWRSTFGYMHVNANYELLNDNLLDLSHAQFIHPLFRRAEPPKRYDRTDGAERQMVWRRERLLDHPTHPFAAMFIDDARIDTWRDTYWHAPSVIHLDVRIGPAGAEPPAKTPSLHLLTPETEATTHYFWTASWNVRREDETLEQRIYHGIDSTFCNEDRPVIELQQRMLGEANLMSRNPILLQTDSTAVRARRIVADMLKAEGEGEAEASRDAAPELVA